MSFTNPQPGDHTPTDAPHPGRVPHLRDGSIVAKVGFGLWSTVGILFFGASLQASGQCGADIHALNTLLRYPAIGVAAHISGDVIMLVNFDHNGTAKQVRVIGGPKLLEGSAVDFSQTLKASASSGSRECPVVVSFRIVGEPAAECGTSDDHSNLPVPVAEKATAQHYFVNARMGCYTVMRDPGPMKRHAFLFHHWYSRT